MLPGAPETTPLGAGSADDDYLVIFSSGSTGEPKGIVHTLASISDSAASFSRLAEMNADTVVYHHFPMFYMAGIFNQFFCALLAGGSIVVGPVFSKVQMLRFWELPLRHGVNCLTLTPTMALSLCQLFRRDGDVLEHLSKYQAVVATGGPLYRSIAERFLAVFKVPLRTCYGVTEIGGTITFQSWEDALAFQSMGSAAPETLIKAGDPAAPAEIVVKTPFMAKGYLIKGQLTDLRDADGFFHTGDLGYLENGLLYFAGREHDLVKKGGEFVSAQLIEDLGLRNSQVTDVAAVGVPDEFWGAKVVLFYVPNGNVNEPEVLAEFEKLFADGLRSIERPDKIIPVPWMPKTSIGKIIKRELVAKYTLGSTPEV
jgi:fatty-acyl-CoA synthase